MTMLIPWICLKLMRQFPVIIANNLNQEQEEKLLNQLRRLNLTILDVVKKEVTKLLAAKIIYPISDSQWVSSVQVVPKKFGMTVMKNRHDKMIHIALMDQHKMTFMCPFGTFAYTRMSFQLCNALSTFQRCMISIFSDLLEDCMEVFMDDFTVYAKSFDACLENLSRVLRRCMDTNLILNFENMFHKELQPDRLAPDVDFVFDQPCKDSFQELKKKLTSVPILQAPNWEYSFELMCDTSNSTLGAVLGQRVGK
ncbi:Retrovirus-related Pol polyprotein, partial [Mucuna pruriens]